MTIKFYFHVAVQCKFVALENIQEKDCFDIQSGSSFIARVISMKIVTVVTELLVSFACQQLKLR